MKPQSKITVFMVVMIVMLSIYYFTMPNDNSDDVAGDDTPDVTDTFSYEEFTALRAQLTEDRQSLVSQLQEVLVADDATIDEKNQAIETIKTISTMSSNEYRLESEIRTMGYMDVLVQSDDDSVVITVLSSELSAEDANKLRVDAKKIFGSSYVTSVSFVPPQETN